MRMIQFFAVFFGLILAIADADNFGIFIAAKVIGLGLLVLGVWAQEKANNISKRGAKRIARKNNGGMPPYGTRYKRMVMR